MTRAPRKPGQETAANLDFQHIRVNRDGYDKSGVYWGAGPDVFIATTAAGAEEITVRARTIAEARQKVAAELERRLGESRVGEPDSIGGNSPHKSRYEIDWLNPATNDTLRIRITHARQYLSSGSDHLEIESIKPKRAPLPITETGYRSHFMPALDLIKAGGPVTFVTAWIDQEAKGKAWTKTVAAKAQGDLFGWAETQGEVANGKRSPKPKPTSAKPAKSRGPKRDPT